MVPCIFLSSSFLLPLQWAHTPLVNSKPYPNPTPANFLSSLPSPVHSRRSLCRSRGKDPSLDPNAESVRAGRFRFRNESGSKEVGKDFGRGGSRRWWSDGSPNDDFEDEFDSIDGEQIWDKIWIFKVFRSYGYLLPAIIASMLLATGPKAFLLALALPLGQSAISLAIDKLWGGEQEERRTSPRIKRRPFSKPSTDFRNRGPHKNSDEINRKAAYQSWVSTDPDLNGDSETDSERPRFGGWDELDRQRGQARRRMPGDERSSQPQVKSGKLSKKGRYRDAPLFFRLLIAFFPFLGSWIRMLL